jgi:hypothetical protein
VAATAPRPLNQPGTQYIPAYPLTMDCPTDLEYLVSLGYDTKAAKRALKASAGDRKGAITILNKGGEADKSDTAWRQELAGDWQTGVTQDLPKSAESRGLWKSPIYCRIARFRRNDDDEIEYEISVVLKDGRKWKVDRSYQHFCDLKLALPVSVALAFKNWFPTANVFFSLTPAQLETRRQQLEDWFHELLLNEDVMNNKAFLDRIYSFIKAYEHGGSGYITAAQQAQRVAEMHENLGLLPKNRSAESLESTTLAALGTALSPKSLLDLKVIDSTMLPPLAPLLNPALRAFPVAMNAMLSNLPFAVATKDLPQLTAALGEIAQKPAGRDKSIAQLEHDYQRDRAIIQGRRLEGHLLSIGFLLEGCKDVINSLIRSRGHQASDQATVDALATRSLQQLSRTESAFISFTAMGEIVAVPDGTFIVPESSLAEPVVLNYRIMDKPLKTAPSAASAGTRPVVSPGVKSAEGLSPSNSSLALRTPSPVCQPEYMAGELLPWCIVCEGLANTVYRVCDGESLKTKIQLKVTYRKTFYIMVNQAGVVPPTGTSASDDVADEDVSDRAIEDLLSRSLKVRNNNVDLSYKDGPTHVVVNRDTHTTGRDWDS